MEPTDGANPNELVANLQTLTKNIKLNKNSEHPSLNLFDIKLKCVSDPRFEFFHIFICQINFNCRGAEQQGLIKELQYRAAFSQLWEIFSSLPEF